MQKSLSLELFGEILRKPAYPHKMGEVYIFRLTLKWEITINAVQIPCLRWKYQ